jgi:CBS domain-containing protein
MATVQDLLSRKAGGVLECSKETTVQEAVALMNDRGTGSVLVTDGGRLTGIFTERDLMRRVVADRLDPGETPLSKVMTTALVTCTPDATIDDCAALMSERRIRHLPVIASGEVCGVVTTGDLLAHELRDKESTIQQLESFVFDVRQ